MRDIYGDIAGSNITVSSSGIGEWHESDLKNLFRGNRRPDESEVYSTFHRGFEWMSDADLTALIAYLRSVPPTENVVERRELSFLDRNTTGFFRSKAEVKGYVPSIAPSFRAEYGQYVADNLAGCARCHSRPGGLFSSDDYLAGGQEISLDGESKVAPNITSSKTTGIGEWSEDDIKRYLSTGQAPSGRQVDKKFCPVEFYARASSADVDALVAYLRSVPAIE
jgi:cytochrome c553